MFIKLVTITDGNSVFTKSQDSTATEFSNALVPGKKSHLKQGGQIVRLISFSYGNSGYLQMFASLVKKSTSLITIFKA